MSSAEFAQSVVKLMSQHMTKPTIITKTCLYNFDPLKPHFYIVKLGFTGVYIIFLISAQNIDCGNSLEPPRRGEAVLTSTHNLCFEQKYEKYRRFLSENFQFLEMKFSMYLNRLVFVMKSCVTSSVRSACTSPSTARGITHLSLNSLGDIEGTCDQWRLWSDCADAGSYKDDSNIVLLHLHVSCNVRNCTCGWTGPVEALNQVFTEWPVNTDQTVWMIKLI